MLAGEAINTKTAALMIGDSFAQAKEVMEELQVDVLPVIDGTTNEVVGQINWSQLEEKRIDELLVSREDVGEPIVIFNDQHLFEGVRMMLEHEMDLLPVVDGQSSFLGTIRKKQLLGLLVAMLNLTGSGSVITVALSPRDFSLTEIVRLIETEGAKIMGVTVEEPNTDHDKYEISIKLNVEQSSRVVSALRRHEYAILSKTNSLSQNVDLAMRAGEFLQYLDM